MRASLTIRTTTRPVLTARQDLPTVVARQRSMWFLEMFRFGADYCLRPRPERDVYSCVEISKISQ